MHRRSPSQAKRKIHDQLLARSGSAKLDVILSSPDDIPSGLRKIFATRSSRIRNLGFNINCRSEAILRMVLSGGQFTSLRGFSSRVMFDNISRLFSILVASEQLDTIELVVEEPMAPTDEMALIFGRVRHLKLTGSSWPMSALVRCSVKLEKLELNLGKRFPVLSLSGSDWGAPIILPELQFLSIEELHPNVLNYIHAPKVSSLSIGWGYLEALGYRAAVEFDYSLIKYLHVWNHFSHCPRYGNCILGSKEPIHCTSFYPNLIPPDSNFILEVDSHGYSRDCFHLTTNPARLQELASWVIPRLINLVELRFLCDTPHIRTLKKPATFSELRSLSIDSRSSLFEHIRAPKLSSLDIKWESSTPVPPCPIWKKFDFASIKHLYIRKGWDYCILGSKERVDCKLFHLVADGRHLEPYDEYPLDCFHIAFKSKNPFSEAFAKLRVAFLNLPPLTNLIELHLLFPCTLVHFRQVIAQTPLIENLIVGHGCKLIDFLRLFNEASFLPRLKRFSFTTFLNPRSLENYANNVGEVLTKCLQDRRKDSPNDELRLRHIILGNCPPLPAIWLDALQKLGVTEITTEKDVESVVIKGSKSHREPSSLLDELEDI